MTKVPKIASVDEKGFIVEPFEGIHSHSDVRTAGTKRKKTRKIKGWLLKYPDGGGKVFPTLAALKKYTDEY